MKALWMSQKQQQTEAKNLEYTILFLQMFLGVGIMSSLTMYSGKLIIAKL